MYRKIATSISYRHSPSSVPLSYKTIGQQLFDTADKFPDNLALVSQLQNKQFTYQELYQQSKNLAASFVALGLQKGDRIGIFSPNNYEWVLTQFAAAMADLILVNVNPAYQVMELKHALNKVECKTIIFRRAFRHSNYLNMFKELAPFDKNLPHLKQLILIDDDVDGYIKFKDLFNQYDNSHVKEVEKRMVEQDPDSITNIQFTSGTTGAPKGASLTHLNILNNGKYVGGRVNYTEKDRVCISVPLYHCFGMVMGNMACINYGSSIILPSDGFSAAASLEAVTNYKCTSLYGVPTMFIEYLNELEKHPKAYDVSSLRTGLIAGSLAPEILMKNIIGKLGMKDISNCYGQTETSPVTSQTKVTDSFEIKTSKVGSPLNMEVKIVDPSTGRTVPYNVPGEYCTRGYAVMKKYWNDEKATREAIDDSGYMHSGDLATMDEDGYISIVGRIKDMIIRGGENVYPKEIEDFILQLEGIEMVQVVGCNDEKFGEEIVALIKMKAGYHLTGLDIYDHCHKKISHFKIPKFVKFVNDFPYTVTGKPQKFKMRQDINKELEDAKMIQFNRGFRLFRFFNTKPGLITKQVDDLIFFNNLENLKSGSIINANQTKGIVVGLMEKQSIALMEKSNQFEGEVSISQDQHNEYRPDIPKSRRSVRHQQQFSNNIYVDLFQPIAEGQLIIVKQQKLLNKLRFENIISYSLRDLQIGRLIQGQDTMASNALLPKKALAQALEESKQKQTLLIIDNMREHLLANQKIQETIFKCLYNNKITYVSDFIHQLADAAGYRESNNLTIAIYQGREYDDALEVEYMRELESLAQLTLTGNQILQPSPFNKQIQSPLIHYLAQQLYEILQKYEEQKHEYVQQQKLGMHIDPWDYYYYFDCKLIISVIKLFNDRNYDNTDLTIVVSVLINLVQKETISYLKGEPAELLDDIINISRTLYEFDQKSFRDFLMERKSENTPDNFKEFIIPHLERFYELFSLSLQMKDKLLPFKKDYIST